ncbi:NAD-dependent dehydratase [Campylobacter sp. MIT 99-7217]|uniref:NAD(P)H-binding protein n=1 Tax=Campylobacter sp. MIT 99-7217 TaxID=535091 RepID=UPI00115A4D47|nr:NAD(P)H-binding protein [Campylobacter sp. MIT 99-7217]TQR33127.1 NAD-dependent dehydratase [Campylobacter sp. MIT 99-7217]
MKILIIGANGSVAREAINGFLGGTKVNLKLFLRNSSRLQSVKNANPERVELVEGSASDKEALKKAMQGVDVVYANLAGDLPTMARSIIEAMSETGLKRLVWISSYGIHQDEYKELPSRNLGAISSALKPYADSAKLIEASNLDYTLIRPQWFSNADEIDYELTLKGEVFKNPDALISRKSIAHLVIKLCLEKDFAIRQSLGINKPKK